MKKIALLSALILSPSVFAITETDVQTVSHEPTTIFGHEVHSDDQSAPNVNSRWYTDTSKELKLEDLFTGGRQWSVNYYTYGGDKLWLNARFDYPTASAYWAIVDTRAGYTLASGYATANIEYRTEYYADRYNSGNTLKVKEARLKFNTSEIPSHAFFPQNIVLRQERKGLWTGLRGYGADEWQTKYTSEFSVFSGHAG